MIIVNPQNKIIDQDVYEKAQFTETLSVSSIQFNSKVYKKFLVVYVYLQFISAFIN